MQHHDGGAGDFPELGAPPGVAPGAWAAPPGCAWCLGRPPRVALGRLGLPPGLRWGVWACPPLGCAWRLGLPRPGLRLAPGPAPHVAYLL